MSFGRLDQSIGGPPLALDSPGNLRRTIYGQVNRYDLADMLRLFDFPDPLAHSPGRDPTTTPLQQLFVLNSDFLQQQAAALSQRVAAEPSDDRAARIEQLLLSGLDHYFGGRYEQAINIWTRVAFLERGHGRARAYIERARSALAERQRESEELTHNGIAAYEAGDLQTARELLTQAVEQGGGNETALLFLQRLSRLDAVVPRVPGLVIEIVVRALRGRVRRNWERGIVATSAAVLLYLAVLGAVMTVDAVQTGDFQIKSINVPSWVAYLPLVLGFALGALEFTRFLFVPDSMFDRRAEEADSL